MTETKRGRGRPPKPDAKQRHERVTLALTKDELIALKCLAGLSRRSVSDYMRFKLLEERYALRDQKAAGDDADATDFDSKFG